MRRAKLIIAEYLPDKGDPLNVWPEWYLKQYSYHHWAARELIRRLDAEPNVSEKVIVSKFYRQMSNYAFAKSKHSDLFFIVQEFAEYMYDVICAGTLQL